MFTTGLREQDNVRGLDDVISRRRSVRRFLPDPVPEAAIVKVIQAATHALSAHNRQPWRFHVIDGGEKKASLAKAMGDQLRIDRIRDGDNLDSVEQDVNRSSARINGAPVLITVCLTLEEMDLYADGRRNTAEFLMAVQSAAMAAQLLLLKAEDLGLGACWLCAPLFCAQTVRTTLALPIAWQPQGLILLGYPGEPGRLRLRKPLVEVLSGIGVH